MSAGTILLGAFGETETTIKRGRRCYHRGGYYVDESERAVTCRVCGAIRDPFDILLQYAQDERQYRWWKKDQAKMLKEMSTLRAEEKRIKARTRNARRKDADAAVADERARAAERMRRVRGRLKSVRSELDTILRNMPDPEDPEPHKPRRKSRVVETPQGKYTEWYTPEPARPGGADE